MIISSPIARFGLIRHAQTTWNQEKRIQGQADSPLTAEGKQRALTWGLQLKQFKWDQILSSDSGRALKTAQQINKTLGIPLHSDSRFREQDWGLWTGKTELQLKNEAPWDLAKAAAMGWQFRPPGGENRNQVWLRSIKALEDNALKWPGQTLLVITHEGVIKCLIYRLYNRQFQPDEPQLILPYRLHWLSFDSAGVKVENLNALELK